MRHALAVFTVLSLGAGARADDVQPKAPQLAAQLLDWELSAHDLVSRVVAWHAQLPDLSPDLSILSCEPVADHKSSGFGWRDDPFRHVPRFHSGTDFRADPGTPVLAAGAGVVIFAGRLGGYGKVIYVDHGGGLVTRYAHLRRIETHKDAMVAAGDQIGQVGSTGRATGPHRHFEIRLDGRPVDPVTGMKVATLERAVPALGRFAAFTLAPALQPSAHDAPHGVAHEHHDHRRPHHTRPERKGRTPRPKIVS